MIELCNHYTTTGYPNFKPRCKVGLRASLKCHSKNSCPMYSVDAGKHIDIIVLDEFADHPKQGGGKNEGNSINPTKG